MNVKYTILILGMVTGLILGFVWGHVGYNKGITKIKEAFDVCRDEQSKLYKRINEQDISDHLNNIREVSPQLRGCFINYYLETNGGWETRHYQYRNYSDGTMVLFDEEGIRIDCEKYDR